MGSEQSGLQQRGNSGSSKPAIADLDPGRSLRRREKRRPHDHVAKSGVKNEPRPVTGGGFDTGRSSPSVCSSDTDVPYVSYTVNRPIGDSPKHAKTGLSKQTSKLKQSPQHSKVNKGRSIVVVSQKTTTDPEQETEIQMLQAIPLFLPIIRSSLSTTHPREPDIVDKLHTASLQRLSHLLMDNLKGNAEAVAIEQNSLASCMREVDSTISNITSHILERQKLYARFAERIARVQEVSHLLSRLQMALYTALDSIETLNQQLPEDERLEPLVWATG